MPDRFGKTQVLVADRAFDSNALGHSPAERAWAKVSRCLAISESERSARSSYPYRYRYRYLVEP
jgi:hypothetical protein